MPLDLCKTCGRPCRGAYCSEHEPPARAKPLTRADRIRSTAVWKRVRDFVIARDGGRCSYGLEPETDDEFSVAHYPNRRCPVTVELDAHHRVPIEDGGAPLDPANLRAVCATHHARLETSYRRARAEARL